MADETESVPADETVVCSACFRDWGLRRDAEGLGTASPAECPRCKSLGKPKLTRESLETLAHRFFVWGSIHRSTYGAAPVIQYNQHQKPR